MSFEEPNDPRSSEIINNQIQLTEWATYEERTPEAATGNFSFVVYVYLVASFLSLELSYIHMFSLNNPGDPFFYVSTQGLKNHWFSVTQEQP